ncbi:transporter substrate-binding domain-containing protein [Pseudoalteromonas sp. R3]|uniref:transporter substrate-binding domain-containing protein n=1 Tax=Pseudoalteromonas sp. R3 TaxID=1709477 RepID=UPI0006B51D3E|nr:transporter substrate-binding domain-containing protein [Pseudoalteromonas sp. R3]AZZ98033.1 transporter substrate-binding domain-containing protein [Pseudoalteromonas sp. R3]
MKVYLLLLTCFTLLCHARTDFETVSWITTDFPPYYIYSDRDEGEGRDEQLITLLHTLIGNLVHQRQGFPASRAIYELSHSNSGYCMISLYKTKSRKKYITYTKHYSTLGLAPGLALRKETARVLGLNIKGDVSLVDLVVKHGLTLGVAQSRSYGQVLDQLIARLPPDQIVVRPGWDTLQSLTNMLLKKRVDLVLGYPSEHYYLSKRLGTDNLTQVSLSGVPLLAKGYIGCTNNAAGRKLVQLFDKELTRLVKKDDYKNIMLKWLPDHLKSKLNRHLITETNKLSNEVYIGEDRN